MVRPWYCDHAITGPVDLLPDLLDIPLDDRPAWSKKVRYWGAGMCRHCGELFMGPTPHRGKKLTTREQAEAMELGLQFVQAHLAQLQLAGNVN